MAKKGKVVVKASKATKAAKPAQSAAKTAGSKMKRPRVDLGVPRRTTTLKSVHVNPTLNPSPTGPTVISMLKEAFYTLEWPLAVGGRWAPETVLNLTAAWAVADRACDLEQRRRK